MLRLHTPEQAAQWLRQRVRGQLHTDSRRVGPGDGFVAWPGAATDGRRFVAQALAQGASACLVEQDGAEAFALDALAATPAAAQALACCPQLKTQTGPVAAAYYGAPSHALDVLAITGTNGKTSTAWWLALALARLQGNRATPCGVIGTLGMGVPPELHATGMTTPDPVRLQAQLRAFADAGLRACAIEASSIGIAERRLDATRIHSAVFTNFTQDHLDYHGSMARYWQAKRELFDWPGLRVAVLNSEDAQGESLAAELQGRAGLDVWTVSCQPQRSRLWAEDLRHEAQGLRFVLGEGADRVPLQTALVGAYNVSNLLGVIAVLRARGASLAEAATACRDLLPVPGRMTPLGGVGQPLVVVDYAHTPDALDQALRALRPLAQARQGRLWCVFGCGGARDAGKRPLMAAVAERGADVVVLTSDNPRNEAPLAIIAQILLGLTQPQQAQVQVDRARAIQDTLDQAADKDVVLLAGKGHEQTQEIAGEFLPFSDLAQARQALAACRKQGVHP